MSTPKGTPVPRKWSPLRRELERLLADGAWHERNLLHCQLARFQDPRLCARAFIIEYRHKASRYGWEAPAAEAFRRDERAALRKGGRLQYLSFLHSLVRNGFLEEQAWNGRFYLRKPPQT